MAVKKSQIYRSLWDSTDHLRGGMDASLYKDYILTLLFVKYVSDRAGQPGALITVPQGSSFTDMKALRGKKDIGEGIDKIIADIAAANGLAGVIDRAFFNDSEKFGRGAKMVDRLTALINIFNRSDLNFSKNRTDDDDILGDAYEYLMRNFATESGKSKGQFYTPSEVSRVAAIVAGIRRAKNPRATVYDPTCGSGSLLLKAASCSPTALAIYGQEMDITTRGLAVMNMILHGQATAEIEQGDVLAEPQFTDGHDAVKKHDYVVANPPFSTKTWSTGFNPKEDAFGRFDKEILPPEKNGDFAFLLHILASLKPEGAGSVILPLGVLFRGGTEAKIREKILRQGMIKGVIGLPANLFYGTGIPAVIIVLDKAGACDKRPVFFVDASKGFMKDGNKNRLRERDVHKITDVFESALEIEGYSRSVPFAEVEANGFNLNIPRYIDGSDPEDLQDIEAHLKGGVPNCDIDGLAEFWDVMPGIRSTLFGPNARPGYSDPLVDSAEVRGTIRNHTEFTAFKACVHGALDGWTRANASSMGGIQMGDKPKQLIHTIAEDMLTRFAGAPLIDRYEAYQRLMSYWAEVMQDDVFIIAHEGWKAAKELREARKETDAKGKVKWLEEADLTVDKVRLVADVIPPRLIVARFFPELQQDVDDAQARAEELGRGIEELVEEHGSESGLLADALTEAGKLTTASIKARQKSGEAEPQEAKLLKQVAKLMTAETAAKKAVKEAEETLTEATLAKYPELTEEEIRSLVVDDKWLTDIADLIDAEIEARTEQMTARVRVLTERYEHTLPEMANKFGELEAKVAEHLRAMGFMA